MPSPHVHTDHKPHEVIAGRELGRTVLTPCLAGPTAVASVENLVLIEPDSLTQARCLNIGHEGLKRLASEEGKNIGQGMKRQIYLSYRLLDIIGSSVPPDRHGSAVWGVARP